MGSRVKRGRSIGAKWSSRILFPFLQASHVHLYLYLKRSYPDLKITQNPYFSFHIISTALPMSNSNRSRPHIRRQRRRHRNCPIQIRIIHSIPGSITRSRVSLTRTLSFPRFGDTLLFLQHERGFYYGRCEACTCVSVFPSIGKSGSVEAGEEYEPAILCQSI